MTGAALRLVPAAKADLQDVWRYTADRWGEAQAENYMASLKRACHELMDSPLLGKPVPDVGEAVLVCRCRHHCIFYLETQEQVTFLAFMHEKRDALRHVLSRLT